MSAPTAFTLGTCTVIVENDLFPDSYQQGYSQFVLTHEGKHLDEAEIYAFIAAHIYDVRTPSNYNAGYVTGWMAALHEKADGPCALSTLLDQQPAESVASKEACTTFPPGYLFHDDGALSCENPACSCQREASAIALLYSAFMDGEITVKEAHILFLYHLLPSLKTDRAALESFLEVVL